MSNFSHSHFVSDQPTSTPLPVPSSGATGKDKARVQARGFFRREATRIRHKLTTRHGWLGDYDYAWLCTPSLPCISRNIRPPPFYALDAELPLVLAVASGLQHSLAMLAGIIAPPIAFASSLSLDNQTSAYLVSACLISSGILSLVQISRLRLPAGYYLGTGLISVVGTSLSTLSTANSIFNAMYSDGTCPTTVSAAGVITRGPCPQAYGNLLGTSMICAFSEIILSFFPSRVLKRLFPPIVTGTVVLMIGASLVGTVGFTNWGGGSNGCQNFPTSGSFMLCPTTSAPRPLLWGSPEFVGLGFLSFISIILAEIFGSPFLKNISLIVGLAAGCIVAGAAGFIDSTTIHTSPAITFLWVYRFKIGVYPPAILPMIAVYALIAMEAIGDTTATAELSDVAVEGPEFETRLQGALLADGIGGFISGLFTVTPISVFAQNNGVVAITRCANRASGRWCCFFLILFGVIGKISGVFLAIPSPVLGGVMTFLFASVAVSGIRVLSFAELSRRDRFVLAGALSFGFGNIIVPGLFAHLFDGVKNPNKGLQGLFSSITIVLSTPSLSSGMIAVILNLLLPRDSPHQEWVSGLNNSTDIESESKGEIEEASR